jgi:ABC-2 type transport system permease protein
MLAKMQTSSAMMYRASFWGAFFADLTLFLIQLLFFGVISQNGNIGDWNIYHLTVFIGTFIALDGLYMATYFFGIISLPDKIRRGTLDLIIIKPVNTLVYTTFSSLNMGSVGLFLVGLGIVFYGGAKLGVLSIISVIQFIIVFILMYILMYALMLCLRCVSFWLTKVNALNKMENTLVEFSFSLPAPGIQGAWKILLFVILPYGLMANMPSVALFGQFGLEQWSLCFGVTSFFLMLSLLLWSLGRSRYDSASS